MYFQKKHFVTIKDIKHFGIDISYLVFDVTDADGNYYQLKTMYQALRNLQSS
jgi:hypothetical protein